MIYISKVHIVGFRCFKDFTVEFNKGKNIIVGNNGTGKSTILDAIHLCLTGLHRGQSIQNVLSPFLFNRDNVEAYLQMCRQGDSSLTLLPHITIEVYLSEEGERLGALVCVKVITTSLETLHLVLGLILSLMMSIKMSMLF